jgi:hypothetical protein
VVKSKKLEIDCQQVSLLIPKTFSKNKKGQKPNLKRPPKNWPSRNPKKLTGGQI